MQLPFLANGSPNGLLSRTIKSAVLLVLISLGAIQVLAQIVVPAPKDQETRLARAIQDPQTTGSISAAARNTVFNPCLIGIGLPEPR